MMDKHEALEQLWQKQSVSLPDVIELKKQWRKLQWLQRLYFSFDILSLLLVIALFVWSYNKFPWFGQIWLSLVMTIVLVFTAYLAWLRRHALSDMKSSTDDYIYKLKAQFYSNIKIAKITKISIWLSLLSVVIFYLGGWLYDALLPETLLNKIVLSAGNFALLVPFTWYWAHTREKKFRTEITKLEKLLAPERK